MSNEILNELNEQQINDIAVEAYIYFYPLILMEKSRALMTNSEGGKIIGRGPVNTVSHARAFPPADFKDVVRPNFDTLYSIAWFDLTKEPVIISMPVTNGKYYMLPILDMWTDVFSVPGKRTTGTKEQKFALTSPGWTGDLPNGVENIPAPTSIVWMIGRIQTNGPDDYGNVHKIQNGMKITPLSQWGKEVKMPEFKADPNIDMKTPPMLQADNMSGMDFFRLATEVTKLNPPHITDDPVISRMKRIGIEPGKSLDESGLNDVVKKAINDAPAKALNNIKSRGQRTSGLKNYWSVNIEGMGVYGTNYLMRAMIAQFGLGANLPEDAIYPMNLGDSEGKPLNGKNKYTVHFDKDKLPPVDAFWSFTVYDPQGFPYPNDMNRCALGDRDDIKFNSDGSLDIFFQHENPGKDKENNWLPTPAEDFNMILRLYSPKAAIINGEWIPPAVTRA